VNDAVDDDLQSINDAPYDKGWLIRVKPDNLGELDTLMTAHAYDEYTRDRGPEE
jgi:glycine cleavage system H protein